MNFRLYSEKQKMDQLFARLKDFIDDDELAAHWSRYLCVLLSGFIENSLKILITEYTNKKSHPNVSNYVSKQISFITNLNYERIQQLLGAFSDNWRSNYEANITDEQKDAIDSIVANRHNIVHGRSVGVSPVQIKEYYTSVLKVVNIIEDKCICL